MSWMTDYKNKYDTVSRRVMAHDAPPEIEQDVEETPPFQGSPRLLPYYLASSLEIIHAEPFWPKRRRRRDVICPVTGVETDHPYGLSRRAWDLIDKGVTYEKERAKFNVDRVIYCFHRRWASGLTEWTYRRPDGINERYTPLSAEDKRVSDWIDLDDLVFRIIGVRAKELTLPLDKTPEEMGWIWLPYEPFDRELIRSNKVMTVALKPNEAELVRRLVTYVRWKVDETAREARQEGSNLLLELATSPGAIEKYNAVRPTSEAI